MSDRDFQAPVRPGSVQKKAQFPGAFPFDAFEWDPPSEATPDLIVKAPWKFQSGAGSFLNYHDLAELTSLAADDEMPIWDKSAEAYKRVTLATLKTWITA